jgi:hypothetical protein
MKFCVSGAPFGAATGLACFFGALLFACFGALL